MHFRIGARELTDHFVPVGEVHAIDEDAEAICGQGRMYVVGEEWQRGIYREVCHRCTQIAPRG